MRKRNNERRKKWGTPPGSVIFTGDRKVEKTRLHYLQYTEADIKEASLESTSLTSIYSPAPDCVQWYDVRGVHDTALIQGLGKVFTIHPLILEDIVDVSQRPKADEYEKGIFVVLKALSFDKVGRQVVTEQVAIYLGDGFVLSFQERAEDLLLAIRSRLQKAAGRIRKKGADYLMYTLLDTIVDQYYMVLEDMEEEMEKLEDEVLASPTESSRKAIYAMKQEVVKVRKVILPMRDVMRQLLEVEHPYLGESTGVFLRDLRDHIFQVLEMVEMFREKLNGLQEMYLSELSQRMNRIMQVLTIVATIFIPLTFIAGIYGMNFQNMPELEWQYGYGMVWVLMLGVGAIMIWYFRRQKWL